MGRFWFDFSNPQIKVPYTRELSPSAGDVDSNGNDVDPARFILAPLRIVLLLAGILL